MCSDARSTAKLVAVCTRHGAAGDGSGGESSRPLRASRPRGMMGLGSADSAEVLLSARGEELYAPWSPVAGAAIVALANELLCLAGAVVDGSAVERTELLSTLLGVGTKLCRPADTSVACAKTESDVSPLRRCCSKLAIRALKRWSTSAGGGGGSVEFSSLDMPAEPA